MTGIQYILSGTIYRQCKAHLRVSAGDGLVALLDTSGDANAVLVATRVGHSSGDPDAVGAANAVGAGNEAAAIEL